MIISKQNAIICIKDIAHDFEVTIKGFQSPLIETKHKIETCERFYYQLFGAMQMVKALKLEKPSVVDAWNEAIRLVKHRQSMYERELLQKEDQNS